MIYAKLIGAGLVLGAIVWLGLIVNGWRNDAAQVPVLEDRIRTATAQIEQERQAVKDAQKASEGYQNELATLRSARSAAPARAVRLCNVPASPAAGEVPGPESGPDGSASGSGGVPPRAGPDIGPRLYASADRADDLSAQVRGLQEYARACSASP